MPASDMRDRMVNFVKTLQKDIVSKLEEVDGSKFTTDRWNRTEGMQDGFPFCAGTMI